ncbi:mannose-1-phosphate guanylyltransferase/phosphomannomutase [Ruminiclostridium sufflavum DSM 19573]|uniref:Mannose-1-phosphate guanylyltransferase/phosphomannomutase n=1 Tax=Ruminiclostridium sufflavum DSM 19573 TaxID=1121337 RepID=A0A318XJI8_9FIRM|nr:mannose-1-phosphate guanyltransferase [Ruminiclostridium sufflavum]PYG87439.1 mannose-1-phosphate guanylyltransferase/phosphomannomutase [Ruminiclostridium sufflavum DSM 19573]
MKAVIMAGGEGSRLRPLTCNRPKPMVPIVNKPVMEHIIELLKKHGIKDIAVTLAYMPQIIKDYFGDGSEFGVNLKYYTEENPLGTAGSVKNAEAFLNETFIVISGDALTDIKLDRALEFHKKSEALVTLVLKKVENPIEYGVVVTHQNGRISRFLEKPSWGEVFSDTVNTGIYVIEPQVLSCIKENQIFDFSKDLFPVLLEQNKPMFGYVTEDYWCDIGDMDAYITVHNDILDRKVNVRLDEKEVRQGVWIGEGAEVEKDAIIKPPVLIGRNAVIKSGSTVGSYSVIGESSHIHENSSIKKSILWKGCTLKNQTQLRGCILCNKVQLRENAAAFQGSVVGDNCIVGRCSAIKPDIKVWPNKHIEAGTDVNSNLVWGSKYSKNLFGNRGVSGEINMDITPEFASKLGATYGAICSKDSKIAVCCDDIDALIMVKTSLMSGLMSSGTEVYDIGTGLLPVTRSAIRFYNLNGGIHISAFGKENDMLVIDVLNSLGSNINRNEERKIENFFVREDFVRCSFNEIKPIVAIPDHSVYYVQTILNGVLAKEHGFKIAVIAKSNYLKSIIEKIFAGLKCEIEFINPNTDRIHKRSESIFSDIKALTGKVSQGGFDVGVYFENSYEKIMLVDTKGRVITDDLYIALISLIHLKKTKGNTVVVPLNASGVIEKMAMQNNGKVIRTKTSTKELMGKMLCDENREKLNDFFAMNFDVIEGLVKIIDYMADNNLKLSEIVDMIPDFHILKKEVKCPWSAKGKVIRAIIEENEGADIETTEGVKVLSDKGWVLVLPDAEEPVCKVISDGYSEEFANELTDIYVNKVKAISNDNVSNR